MNFLIHYDAVTGKILERRPTDIEYPTPISEPYIEINQNQYESTLNNNKIVNINTQELEDIVLTLDELKAKKLIEISNEFDIYVAGKVTISLGWDMQFNQRDISMVDGAVRYMEIKNITTGYLTDAYNVNHYDLPIADMKIVLTEMMCAYMEAHAKKQILRSQIDACTSVEELNNIVW